MHRNEMTGPMIDVRRGTRRVAAAVLVLAAFVVAPGGARAGVFSPVADTYTRVDCKSCNYGTDPALRENLNASVGGQAFVKFTVQGLQAPVASAAVRLLGVATWDGSTAPIQLRGVADSSWGELTLTGKNAPVMGAVVATSPGFAAGQWVQLDATSLVAGNGVVSMGLTATDPSLARKQASREDEAG